MSDERDGKEAGPAGSRSAFSEKVMREAADPKNVGRLNEPDGFAEVTGECGDTVEMYMVFRDGKAEMVRFYTDGCGPTIACGSATARMAEGKGIGEIELISWEDIAEELDGLPDSHVHCARLAARALTLALRNYQEKLER